jgi:hypothetical protein
MCVAVPLATFDFTPGAVSESEYRTLADFPPLVGRVEPTWPKRILGIQNDLINYINDRVGFRLAATHMVAFLKVKALGITSNLAVLFGTDGYLVNNQDHDLIMAAGKWQIDPGEKAAYIAAQQRIQAYYDEKGVDYYVVATPQAPDVAYEYFPYKSDTSGQNNPLDVICGFLDEEAGVKTINVRQKVLEYSALGQVTHKRDTHWTSFGAYAGAIAIVERLQAEGYDIAPIDESRITWDTVAIGADHERLLGYIGIMEGTPEVLPAPVWDYGFVNGEGSEGYGQVKAICEAMPAWAVFDLNYSEIHYFENPDAPYGTLLIYGDSQMNVLVPSYLAEYFKKVVHVGVAPRITPALDDLLQPDVVMVTMVSRRTDPPWSRLATADDLVP